MIRPMAEELENIGEEITPETQPEAASEAENVKKAGNRARKTKTSDAADDVAVEEGSDDDSTPVFQKPVREVVDLASFDWEKYEHEITYSDDDRKRLNDVYDNTLSQIAEREVLMGTIVAKTKKEVVINIGYKSEGVVPAGEFRYNPDMAVGDKVEVYVESQEDRNGQLIISHKKARTMRAWERVNTALESGEIVMGYVKCRTKGGLIVDVFGLEAFLPGSQIDVKPIRDYDVYVGKNMEFKVVKINHEFKNVVVSHKALIEAELEQQKRQIIGGLEKGQVLEGIVKNITSYGVFIDLGGVDGLIHITDLSWGRINHPEEIVQLDSKINVVILDFDDDKKRIALGLKQLNAHPWEALDPNMNVGDKVKGKVVVLADYGAFVEVAPGVEGLVHVSEMSWSQHLRSAQDFLKVGDEVEAIVLNLDREERKMSLGMKQLMPDPWDGIDVKYPVGSKHSGKVLNFTNFGVFIEMEEGVDGLIHISDLSWDKKVKHPSEFCKVGDVLDVVVLEVDMENRRLSVGHKQLQENPWDVFESVFTVDSVHEGTIINLSDKNAIVSLPYGLEGLAPKKYIKKEDGSNAKVEEKLNFMVLEFNKEAKKIILSHLHTYDESAERAEEGAGARKKVSPKVKSTNKMVQEINDSSEKTTLGDLGALAALKDEMSGKKSKKKDDSED
jgi:small subunit ribosomal protein S1